MMTELKNWAGVQLHGMQFNIDIINACPLSCPSCAVGSIGRRKGGYMSLDLFRRILDKAQSETKIRHIQFYAYSEACLHPEFPEFIRECNRRDIRSYMSTMLQTTKCDFRDLIDARPTEFRISFPGWEKMSYYQRGAKPEVFDKKFAYVVTLPRHPETTWTMAFHAYNDNAHERPRAQKLAEDNGIKFVNLPAIFMPCEKVVEKNYSEEDKELISHLYETPEEAISRMDVDHSYCLLWKQITIDSQGMVYLCQLVYEDRFKMVPFLDHPLAEITGAIKSHPFCSKCLEAGGHTYQYCYDDFTIPGDPVELANRKRSYARDAVEIQL